MIGLWLAGLIRHRWRRLAAAALGIALAVGLMASLGSFLAATTATMTRRASAGVAIDWQVQVDHGPAAPVLQAITADPGTRAAVPVTFAATPGFAATTQGTTQTTGAGQVLGLPAAWARTFPLAIRVLTGRLDGALVAQQTAANLQVQVGDTVRVRRAGAPPYAVRIAGVVDLQQADSLFQKVGAPPQSQLSAPPDNVLLLPPAAFAHAYGGRSGVVTQIHVRRSHSLPADPAAAYVSETGAARHLELVSGGAAVVGDNLGSVLGSAREDAAYARILFLFLGLPGAVLAALITAAVARSGAARRQREQALLRSRGATSGTLWALVLAETVLVALGGAVVGLGAAAVVGAWMFGSVGFGAGMTASVVWAGGAVVAGLLVALVSVAAPARHEIAGRAVARAGWARPRWLAYGLDLVLLAVAAALVIAAGRNQYQLVLAPEGVPSISVSYWAFLAPGLAWVGATLATWRLADLVVGPGRRLLGRLLRPVSAGLAPTAALMLSRQRSLIARSVVLLALALAFAISTATFDATYRQQAEVDAELTNGADVTVTEPPGSPASQGVVQQLRGLPGVADAEPLLHRYAYVGSDLQDLYGIDPHSISRATSLQDAYFQGGTADQLLRRLATTPDGALVSAETVNDYQLSPGDTLRLRLQDQRSGRYLRVTFTYVGIVNEFPTAPKDSFIVANSAYVAQQTKDPSVATVLVRTDTSPRQVAGHVRAVLGPGPTVGTLDQARGLVSSSLTSIDMSGLTRLELAYAVLVAGAAGGLVLALSLNERRRTVAVLTALGARRNQLARIAWAEPVVVIVMGVLAGLLTGWGMSRLLVTMLTGVFDPPPSSLAYPWTYLATVVVGAVLATAVAAHQVLRQAGRSAREALRESLT
ncbi:FtsX-like permease family protein [Nocardioides ginsengisoli]|uniref:ABC transporter permease n=1 Tax=Nocardioides ginsengisoli TaxID=363868 RepID=A0ABW3VVA2_9ACTN